MSFVRPEIIASLRRWRETLAGIVAIALGAYWLILGQGNVWILGAGSAIAGVLLALAGIQRARFRQGDGGAGVVRVVEGQLSYFGPYDGGVLSIDQLSRVAIHDGIWILSHDGGPPLEIPTTAEGAEALFDILANLPGLRTHEVLAALNADDPVTRILWDKRPKRLH